MFCIYVSGEVVNRFSHICSFPASTILAQVATGGVNVWILLWVCTSILLHHINSVLWHKPFWKTFFPQDHVLCSSCAVLVPVELCAEKLLFSVCYSLYFLWRQTMWWQWYWHRSLYLPFFAHPLHILTTLFITLLFRCQAQTTSLLLQLELLWFSSCGEERDRPLSRCWEFDGRECTLSFHSV